MSYQQYRPSSFNTLPLVIKNLLIINGLLFLATWVFKNQFGWNLVDTLGLHYFSSELFQPYQFVTYMFMHGGIDHIFFNMFALWMFGNVLENVWGPKRFLIFYMVTGIGAALIYMGYEAFIFIKYNNPLMPF
jgi:membrane associated rhomboid family serine protease